MSHTEWRESPSKTKRRNEGYKGLFALDGKAKETRENSRTTKHHIFTIFLLFHQRLKENGAIF